MFTPIFTPTLDVTALYIGLTVSRAVCRALQLYSSRYASTALQLYNALHSTISAPTLRHDGPENRLIGKRTYNALHASHRLAKRCRKRLHRRVRLRGARQDGVELRAVCHGTVVQGQ